MEMPYLLYEIGFFIGPNIYVRPNIHDKDEIRWRQKNAGWQTNTPNDTPGNLWDRCAVLMPIYK